MDIQYLLFLQDFRNSVNDALTPLMEWISKAAVDYLILFPIFYYWACDKKKGLYVLVSYYFCILVNSIVKLTACVYRPWIRDARILPAGDSIRTATSYSFPSGHILTAAPLAGGMAVNLWQEKRTRVFSVLFAIFILLTMFSRNYLGVHTPQDVLVACLISIVSLFGTAKLFKYLGEHPEKEDLILLCGFVVCWISILYITVKSYPMDYNESGKLIVDPKKMMNDGYGDIGKAMGFIIARFVEKKWIKFKNPKLTVKILILCLVGLAIMIPIKTYFRPVLTSAFGSHWGKLIFSVIYAFYSIAFFPLVLKLYGNEKKNGY